MIDYCIILFVAVLLFVLSLVREYDTLEFFSQKCSKLINPTCKKKTIFSAISKLEDDISELTYLFKNRSNNIKYDKMYKWYKEKLYQENKFSRDATDQANEIGKQFIKDATSRIENDMKTVRRTSQRKLNKDRRRYHKNYRPLNLK